MSPHPAQVDHDMIVNKARDLIEAEGLGEFSLARLATALGVKAPSLYKHVASKAALLRAVNTLTVEQLVAAMRAAQEGAGKTPVQRLVEIARAYRLFAHTYPAAYALAFADVEPELRPDPQYLESLVLPLQAITEALVGQEHSLAALRGIWALIHGFVMLELAGQFQRGGDLSSTFIQAVEACIRGWQISRTSPSDVT
jgi:AcrR family transcriptional regulator